MTRRECVICGEVFWRVPQTYGETVRRRLSELTCIECLVASIEGPPEALLERNRRAPWNVVEKEFVRP